MSNRPGSEWASGVTFMVSRRDDQSEAKHFLDEAFRQRAGDSATGSTMFEDGYKGHLRIFCGDIAGEPPVVSAWACFGCACLSGDRNIF
jgi:hypothetical protein